MRGYGIGSIRLRRDRRRKRWEARVWLGGKRVSVYCASRQEAIVRLARLVLSFYEFYEDGSIFGKGVIIV